jgi:hypothetical protein
MIRQSTEPPVVVSKGVYSLCYYLSFGAVYAGQLAIGVFPPDSIVRHGLRDGADAARRAWARSQRDEAAEAEMELPVDVAADGL